MDDLEKALIFPSTSFEGMGPLPCPCVVCPAVHGQPGSVAFKPMANARLLSG